MWGAVKNYRTALMTAFVWTVYYVFASLCSKRLSAIAMGFIIRVVCLLLLGAFLLFDKAGTFRIDRRAVPLFLIIGFNSFMLDFTAFSGFQATSNSATGTLLLKSDVIMVNIVTVLLTRQKFRLTDWLFTLLALVGVCFVLDVSFDSGFFVRPANLYFLGSAAFVTFNVFVIRHTQAKFCLEPATIGFYNNLMSLLWFTGALLLTGVGHAAKAAGTAIEILLWLLVASVGQCLIYIYYYKSIGKYPIWIVKVVLLLIPVLSMAADLVMQKPLSPMSLVGAAIVLASAAGVLLTHRETAPTTIRA